MKGKGKEVKKPKRPSKRPKKKPEMSCNHCKI